MAVLPLQVARVSNQLRMSLAQGEIARTQNLLLQVQNQLSTGKKINAASDDPGNAAIVLQLQKLIEQRGAYSTNLKQATAQLGQVDSSLDEMSGLLRQVQQIASANVGSDVSADARSAAATIVGNIYSQMVTLANQQFEGVYIFAGDRSNSAPFVSTNGGVEFVGSSRTLKNQFDENTQLSFMVDGAQVFGATSTRMAGATNLSPTLTSTTRLVDIAGAMGEGVRLGSVQISNGSTTAVVDLLSTDTVGDVMNKINAAGIGGITASISASGTSLQLTGSGGDNISVNEVGGGLIAHDLGIFQASGSGAGNPVAGANIGAKVTELTHLSALRGGTGIELTGFSISNGAVSKTIDMTGMTTVQDLINAINGTNMGVQASVNADGTGINVINLTQGIELRISETGGTTAADLGIRSFSTTDLLSGLNNGKGLRTSANGADLQVTRADGTSFAVDFDGAVSVQDVIDRINTADAGGGVTASFSTTGNGIVLTDSTGGAGTLAVMNQNSSHVMEDLGLGSTPVGNVITGTDVNPISVPGVFANLLALKAALQTSDQAAITDAAASLQGDLDRSIRIRGETGARIQDLEARQSTLEDQNTASQTLLSNLQDTDFTEAITRFQTLQTSLQATLQMTARVLSQSLLDYLG